MPVVALVADLIFDSKIAMAARAAGVDVRLVRAVVEATALLPVADGLVVDLNADPEGALALVSAARAQRPEVPIVGFLAHVQVELAARAREAGADQVLPRSELAKRLEEILRGFAKRPD